MPTPPPVPANEAERLRRLEFYKILDTPAEDMFDRVTRLAAHIMQTPIALVSLVDRDRQWFKSRVGLDATETPRAVAFCAHAIMANDVFVVEDATKDGRFADNPLVADAPGIRFYAGVPLTTTDGLGLGTLCTIDVVPRTLTQAQHQALTDLGQIVMDELDLRTAGRMVLEDTIRRAQLDELKNAFVSDVNHELRTPLTAIMGALDLVHRCDAVTADTQALQLIDIAGRNAKHLLTLINDLLDMSKLESGRMQFTFVSTDIGNLIANTLQDLAHYAEHKHVALAFAPPSRPIVAHVDPERLTQVLNNLLSNAIKFGPGNSTVRVTLTAGPSTFRIDVIDRGPGIPVEKRGRVFQKFFQAAPSEKTGIKGTGLGLTIAKSIVESHGGRIGFTSPDEGGTLFFVEIPLAFAPASQ